MKFAVRTLFLCAGLLLAAALPALAVDTKDDYHVFLDRNPFGLKPPEPPPKPPEPPKAPETIKLTGIVSLIGPKRALMVRTEPGQPKPEYLSMMEGTTNGAVIVIAIDEVGGTVQITNGGIPKTLNFKDDGIKPVAVAAVAPGMPGAPGMPPNFGSPNPNAPSPLGVSASPPSPRPGSRPPPTPSNTASAPPAVITTGAAVSVPDTGLRPSPTRTIRFDGAQPNSSPPPAPVVDPAVQTILIEANRIAQPPDFPPLPPTSAPR